MAPVGKSALTLGLIRVQLMLMLTLFAHVAAFSEENPLIVSKLRCEYLAAPEGIDAVQPRLGWILLSAARAQKQTGYQVIVASSQEAIDANQGDLWDSGKVDSDQSVNVAYAGKALVSFQRCYWKVRVWDKAGQASAWSAPARWSMGLLQASDWTAKWVGLDKPGPETSKENPVLPARMLRREFTVPKSVARATAYVCGLGLFELHLNGAKVGDHVLEPALTEYDKREFYVTFDVTDRLAEGKNALGVLLGNGRYYAPRGEVPTHTRTYGYPKLLLQLRVEYRDGSFDTIVSDESWKLTTDGPIRANNEYDGEVYDAQMELAGWDRSGFDDASWQAAQTVEAPGGVLSAQMMAPIRVMETLHPVAITNPAPGVYVYDMGQNMVGWCRLKVEGPKGTKVTLRHAETIHPDGTLYLDNIRGAKVTDTYVLKGGGAEVYEPRFTYHGFRYVELCGYPGEPGLATIEGCVVHDAVERAGSFACSNPLLNQIYKNIYWGVRGNYRSLPTDCPQRDERQGWLGDRAAECRGETSFFDISALYAKWVGDIADAQKENGSVSDVCPSYWPLYNDNVTWPSAFIIIPEMLRTEYGDARVAERHYAGMKKWIDHMCGFVKDGIIAKDNYGDWCVPPEEQHLIHSNDPARKTPGEVVATAYLYHDLDLMRGYAEQLGKADDALHFAEVAAQLLAAFQEKFFNKETFQYANGSQTSSVLPLAFGMVPAEYRERVFARLVEKIEGEGKSHIGTGLIGGQWLMRTLTENGRADLAYTIASQKDYPSWGYMIGQNATTIWELWNGNTADPAMNSHNHVMLVGDLGIWMHECLAGIRPDAAQPGFKHVVMRPYPAGDLEFVNACRETPHGTIYSAWRANDKGFTWDVTIPPNTTATVHVPANDAAAVTESGKPAGESEGLAVVRMDAGAAVYEAASGHYAFNAPAFTRPGAGAR